MAGSLKADVVLARPKARMAVALVPIALGGLVAAERPADANHIYARNGDRGYHWFARYYDNANVYVSSDGCQAAENPAWDRVAASTAGTAEFGRWPSGIDFTTVY